MAIDYKQAGVDIEKGDDLVAWLKSSANSKVPHADRLVSGIGGFSALFRGDFPEMKEPLLVSATDGVGTKLKLAIELKSYSGLGQDLVAMCVNDMVCCGAQPLFFLDYFATGKLELEVAKEFLVGLRQACVDAQCLLIGGETAEMPGMYKDGDFDCAGFSVGVVDREKVILKDNIESGDVVIGIESSGFHSNGYSLVRKLFEADSEDYKSELLEPTRLYVAPILDALKKFNGEKQVIRGIAHITGGGMDNLLRVLPEKVGVKLNTWEMPKIMKIAKKRSGLKAREFLNTFNCGFGLQLIVDESKASEVCEYLNGKAYPSRILGEVVTGDPRWEMNESEFDEKNAL